MPNVSVDLVSDGGATRRGRRDGRSIISTLAFAGALAAVLISKPKPAEIVTDPNPIDFGQQTVGRRAEREVSFVNMSKSDVVVEGVMIAGDSGFSVSSQCRQLPCKAQVIFAPQTEGAQSATISIPGTAARVSVSGFGVMPGPRPPVIHLLQPDVASIDFANVKKEASVTFTNAGNDDVAVSSPTLDGPSFAITNHNCLNRVLAPGDTCFVALTSTGSGTGTLSVVNTSGRVEASVTLTGIAPLPPPPPPPSGPRIRTDRTTIAFAPEKPDADANLVSRFLEMGRCDRCSYSTIHIFDEGPGLLTIQDVTIEQDGKSYDRATNCSTLTENASCLVVVFWRPQTPHIPGRIRIDSNATENPKYIDIQSPAILDTIPSSKRP